MRHLTNPKVSIVVASHGRPEWLSRCLTAIAQLDYSAFEVIVAADQAGLAAVAAHPSGKNLKTVVCDTPNISQTRNAGAGVAAGDVFAFIDDDAVPEPLWLKHHVAALEATGAAASVGYVRGRNGISFQSRAVSIDRDGVSHDENASGNTPWIPHLSPGRAVKLIGTNFTVRRDALISVGGFDPAFRFYLDDSDLSVRLAEKGLSSTIAPLAEVHHGFAPSERRTSRRFPKSLLEIARSTAIFARKHSHQPLERLFERAIAQETARLEKHLIRGTCEPRDIQRVLQTFMSGWEEGLEYVLQGKPHLDLQPIEFKRFSSRFNGHVMLASRLFGRAEARKQAEKAIGNGRRATHISLSPTTLRHRNRFTDAGYWEQTGGLFGPSDRSQPWFRWCTFANRVKEECHRVEMQRGIMKNGAVWGDKV